MSRKLSFGVDEFYHLYNRGGDKRQIFNDHSDYDRFLRLLYLCNDTKPVELRRSWQDRGGEASADQERELMVDIGTYCLMPNHFHLLVKERVEGGISIFMHKLSTGYSMYFNLKHERTGSLFEGAFKAKHIDGDEYLKYSFAYIHLNPVKLIKPNWREQGIGDTKQVHRYLESYPYSSYNHYVTNNKSSDPIINQVAFPDYFNQKGDFINYLNEWLKYNEDEPAAEAKPPRALLF
ncbi:MAG: transposase [Candidatus Vogelbacteria bacterium]|nr:transposase [Candidatus Vogelbacteria bacterium]